MVRLVISGSALESFTFGGRQRQSCYVEGACVSASVSLTGFCISMEFSFRNPTSPFPFASFQN